MKSAAELRILMISLDPVLLGQGSGDVLQRHIDYASRVHSLDIIVLGGTKSESKKVSEKLTIHSTGGTGIMKAFRADGARKASAIANPKLAEVKEKIGLL
jgi:hypothetical protein